MTLQDSFCRFAGLTMIQKPDILYAAKETGSTKNLSDKLKNNTGFTTDMLPSKFQHAVLLKHCRHAIHNVKENR